MAAVSLRGRFYLARASAALRDAQTDSLHPGEPSGGGRVAVLSGTGDTSEGFVIGTSEGLLLTVDCSEQQLRETFCSTVADSHESSVTDIAVSSNSKVFVSAARDGRATVWDTRASKAAVHRLQLTAPSLLADCYSCALDVNDRALACAVGPNICLFDMRQIGGEDSAKGQGKGKSKAALMALSGFHTDVVGCVRFHPEIEALLISGGDDDIVSIFNVKESGGDEADNARRVLQAACGVGGRKRCYHASNTEDSEEKRSDADSEESDDVLHEDRRLVGAFSNGAAVRHLSVIGPQKDVICTTSTTDDVNLWKYEALSSATELHSDILSLTDLHSATSTSSLKRRQLLDDKTGEVVMLEEAQEDTDLLHCTYGIASVLKVPRQALCDVDLLRMGETTGSVVSTVYDTATERLHAVCGGPMGHLLLIELNLDGIQGMRVFMTKEGATGHEAPVCSAASLSRNSTSHLLTGCEGGVVCLWDTRDNGAAAL